MNKRIDILIGTKNRATEVALLLQSLRTQTYQEFDIFILDDQSDIPIEQFYFMHNLYARMKAEGHKVYTQRNQFSNGVTRMRNQMAKWACEVSENDLVCRVDDDTILESDFLERLVAGIDKGYSLMSGITPPIMQEPWKRDTSFVKPLISKCKVTATGVVVGDDTGYAYLQDEIIPSEHFRSMCLYLKSIHTKDDIWYAEHLTKHGFREEEFFSYPIIIAGHKIGVDVQAICWHQLTPSGGERGPDEQVDIQQNQVLLNQFVKELQEKHGDFFKTYYDEVISK